MNIALQLLALAVQLEPDIAKLFTELTATDVAALDADEASAYNALLAAIAAAKAGGN